MIDPMTEELLTACEAAKTPPLRNSKSGKPCHVAQVFRYFQPGARDINGGIVKLESIKTPSGLRTSREAIVRFINRLTNPNNHTSEPTPKERGRQIAAAQSRLAAAGI